MPVDSRPIAHTRSDTHTQWHKVRTCACEWCARAYLTPIYNVNMRVTCDKILRLSLRGWQHAWSMAQIDCKYVMQVRTFAGAGDTIFMGFHICHSKYATHAAHADALACLTQWIWPGWLAGCCRHSAAATATTKYGWLVIPPNVPPQCCTLVSRGTRSREVGPNESNYIDYDRKVSKLLRH